MTTQISEPRDKLIVALDFPTVLEAECLVDRLGEWCRFYKIGMELAYGEGGFDFVKRLVASGARVFLDLKLHDISNTVERAVAKLTQLGVTFLTVHGYPQTMQAAVLGARDSDLKILAVTVLTSYNEDDLIAAGYYHQTVEQLVERRAYQAHMLGVHGLVLSPLELTNLYWLQQAERRMTLVTPGIRPLDAASADQKRVMGIRPLGAATDDQKRVMTPANAIAAGSDYLVVGRPITRASNPRAAARSIVAEIAAASDAL